MEPFEQTVPDEELHELHDRLRRTRFPKASPGPAWSAGMPPDELRRIVDHWLHAYDWRAQEARLNAYPQYLAEVGGQRLHFVHVPATTADAPAIVLTHGWPYTFAEMLPLLDELRGEFSVVVPSLPGFVHSPATEAPFTGPAVAALWQELMTGTLGYRGYLVYGEDVGASVSDWLAALHPGSVTGIIAPHPAFGPEERRQDASEEEQRFFRWLEGQWAGESGYSAIQSSKPDTLAASVGDSPAGLAAWIIEKFRAWSDGDGPVEQTFGLDALLTTVMLYWTTDSIGTSFRPYLDDRHQPPLPQIRVPAAVIVQQHERQYPRALAERSYLDLRSFDRLERGGHFTAAEAAPAVAGIIRAFAHDLPRNP